MLHAARVLLAGECAAPQRLQSIRVAQALADLEAALGIDPDNVDAIKLKVTAMLGLSEYKEVPNPLTH